MKGIVFTEFTEMVEEKFGFLVLDNIIQNSKLDSEGSYTAIGSYNYLEFMELLKNLNKETKIDLNDLIMTFSKHLFKYFKNNFKIFFERENNVFDFLESVEDYIHVEVKKLYFDADLPTFQYKRGEKSLEIIYSSEKPFAKLAEGLIKESIKYYNEKVSIYLEEMNEDNLYKTKFILTKGN